MKCEALLIMMFASESHNVLCTAVKKWKRMPKIIFAFVHIEAPSKGTLIKKMSMPHLNTHLPKLPFRSKKRLKVTMALVHTFQEWRQRCWSGSGWFWDISCIQNNSMALIRSYGYGDDVTFQGWGQSGRSGKAGAGMSFPQHRCCFMWKDGLDPLWRGSSRIESTLRF